MIKNKHRNLLKDFCKKKSFLKNEIKKIILKSVISNKNCTPVIRMLATYKYSKLPLNTFISKQNNNICVKTGKIKSVLKITNYSRHYLKKLLNNNVLQNFKISRW